MKRTPGMGMNVEPERIKLPKYKPTIIADKSDNDKEVDILAEAEQAPFEDRFRILSRPFLYLLKVNTMDQKSIHEKMNGFLKKNITNKIWASGLAQEIQYIIICEIKHAKPASRTRDNIIVSTTNYMAQIFEQILDLFESTDYHVIHDIEGLFELLTESVWRLESTITPTFHESIRFNDTRKVLREYKEWVIEHRSEYFDATC